MEFLTRTAPQPLEPEEVSCLKKLFAPGVFFSVGHNIGVTFLFYDSFLLYHFQFETMALWEGGGGLLSVGGS